MTPREISQLLATTISKREKRIWDQITLGNIMLYIMQMKGRVTATASGTDIRVPILIDDEEFAWYKGMDPLTRATRGVIEEAIYDPARAAASITIPGDQLDMNRGQNTRIVNLLKTRTDNAINTAKSNITKAIYADGTTADSFPGLGAFITETPELGVVGGVDASVIEPWRNQVEVVNLVGIDTTTEDGGKAAFRALRSGMNKLQRRCTRGTEKPDLVTLDPDSFDLYEGGLQDNQRYASAKLAEVGFETLRHKGASVTSEDEGVGHPDDGGFMLNTDMLALEHYAGRKFQLLDLSETSPDVDAITKHIGFFGALTMKNRARQGRLVVNR